MTLLFADKDYLTTIIQQIEEQPKVIKKGVDFERFNDSKARWLDRNDFLMSYIRVMELRTVDADGKELKSEERFALITQAISLMDLKIAA